MHPPVAIYEGNGSGPATRQTLTGAAPNNFRDVTQVPMPGPIRQPRGRLARQRAEPRLTP